MLNPLQDFVRQALAQPGPEPDWKQIGEPPESPPTWQLIPCAPPSGWTGETVDLEEARIMIRSRIAEYLDRPFPAEMLLVKALPGVGKTTAAASVIDDQIAAGKRVVYAGPRHDFFADVIAKSSNPGEWYEWQPRQAEDVDAGKPQTCNYAEQIATWMRKGYEGMKFCSGVCGWDYVNKTCVYHRQKATTARVIYGQHQHIALGHPLMTSFDLLIGDESPIGAFTHEWRIPADQILPPGIADDEPIKELLHLIHEIASYTKRSVEGEELLQLTLGAHGVLEACTGYVMPDDLISAETIYSATEVDNKPYFHIFHTANLLAREARQAVAGVDYPHRVILSQGHMTLLLRRNTPNDLPQHVVWLDATGRPEIYQELFKRPVEVVDAAPKMHGAIYQVVDRGNGKAMLTETITGEDGLPKTVKTKKADQSLEMVREIVRQYNYQRPTIITFKSFAETIQDEGFKVSHFHASRGMNSHEDADAVFVVGAPLANSYSIVTTAKMIWWNRETAFKPVWALLDRPYRYVDPVDGLGRAYPVGGYWQDANLQTLVETVREDEIIQSAHRGRPVNHPVDIWLLTNVPVDALPPTALFTSAQIFQSPQGVNSWKWLAAKRLMDSQDVITVDDLMTAGMSRKTASEYLDMICEMDGWTRAAVKTGRRGMPPKVATKRNSV